MADTELSLTGRGWLRWVALAAVIGLVVAGVWALRRAASGEYPGGTVTPGQTVTAVPPGVGGGDPGGTVTPGQTVTAVPPGVGGGDPGVWVLADPASVTSASTSIAILVSRLGCSSGRTGTVLLPVYALTETAVSLRTDVAAIASDGAQTCPGNDQVPITVVLPEPIGNRSLVDEACSQPPASTTSFCLDKGVRRA